MFGKCSKSEALISCLRTSFPCSRAVGSETVRTVLLFLSILIFSTQLNATCIVALIDNTKHRLVIAADCQVNHELTGPISGCKILYEANCIVAIAGLYVEKAAQFDLRKLVESACRQPGDLRAKADAFLQIAKVPYERAVQYAREADPTDFHIAFENKPTEVIFAGIQEGHLALLVRGFAVDSAGSVTVERYESPDITNTPAGYFMGLNDHIKEYVSSHEGWQGMGYSRAAHQFVEMEIDAHPGLAGRPISEIEIDNRGKVRWLTRGACVPRKR